MKKCDFPPFLAPFYNEKISFFTLISTRSKKIAELKTIIKNRKLCLDMNDYGKFCRSFGKEIQNS